MHHNYIFDYFGNTLDLLKVKNLHLYSIACAIFHIKNFIKKHSEEYLCYRFKCQVCQELIKNFIQEDMKTWCLLKIVLLFLLFW